MKKQIVTLVILLVFVGLGVGAAFLLRPADSVNLTLNEKIANTIAPLVSTSLKDDNESLVVLEKVVAVTPDDKYSYGAFCRVNYLVPEDNFFVTFGGANRDVQNEKIGAGQIIAGGAEGGNGYSYKIYSKDFEYTGENGVVHEGGGDAAGVLAGDYLYFLTGAPPNDWQIQKIDPVTWQEVDKVFVDTDGQYEILNDMMLAYANGQLIAGGLYDASGTAEGNQKGMNPNVGAATHNRFFDLDLKQTNYFVLDDVPHINGSYVVFANGAYYYITSTAYFGDLIVMRYDENWNFIDSKILDVGGQWSQGALFDETTGRFYVAFIDMTLRNGKMDPRNPSNIALGIFDQDWNLLEKVNVTNYSATNNKVPGRPPVILKNNKLYVSYDVSTNSILSGEEKLDWQCEVSIYDLK